MINILQLFFHPMKFFLVKNRLINLKNAILYLSSLYITLGVFNFGIIHFLINKMPSTQIAQSFMFVKNLDFFRQILFFITNTLDILIEDFVGFIVIFVIVLVLLKFYKKRVPLTVLLIIICYSITAGALSSIISDIYIIVSYYSTWFSEMILYNGQFFDLIYYGVYLYTFF